MKIVMLRTASACGKRLDVGTSHDLPDGEAEALIRQGAATPADATRDVKPASKGKSADAG